MPASIINAANANLYSGTATAGSTVDVALAAQSTDVSIQLVTESPAFVGSLIVQYSPDNSLWVTLGAVFVENMSTGDFDGLEGAPANGSQTWRVSLPGGGNVRVTADAYTSGSVGVVVTVDAGGARQPTGPGLRNSLGQSPPLSNVYLVNPGVGATYSGMCGDALGNVSALSSTVPHATAASGSNLLSALGPPAGTVWAVFFAIPNDTYKYSGASGSYANLNAKLYPATSTLDVGPVPAEYLQTQLSVTPSFQLNAVVNDTAGTPLNVIGTNDSGKNSLYANPNAAKSFTNVPVGATGVITGTTDSSGDYATLTIQALQNGGGGGVITIEASNDNASYTAIHAVKVTALGLYVFDVSGWGCTRLNLTHWDSGSYQFRIVRTQQRSSAPPPPAPAAVRVGDHTMTATQNGIKGGVGSFLGAVVENLSAKTLYFNLYDAATVSGTPVASWPLAVLTTTSIDATVLGGIWCVTDISWNVSDSRSTPTSTHSPASDVNITLYYK